MTAEELLRLPDDGRRHELIAGELRTMPPTGSEHGVIVTEMAASLRMHVRANRLGWVLSGEPGFQLAHDPDTVRAPDVAFVRRERFAGGRPGRGYPEGAPDLAVEVISPSDLYTEVEEKVVLWFAHGARLVIVINPRRKTVAVYEAPTRVRILTEADTLDGGEVVSGWTMPVAAIFEEDGAE
jgi:Uma2 family endonuclease